MTGLQLPALNAVLDTHGTATVAPPRTKYWMASRIFEDQTGTGNAKLVVQLRSRNAVCAAYGRGRRQCRKLNRAGLLMFEHPFWLDLVLLGTASLLRSTSRIWT